MQEPALTRFNNSVAMAFMKVATTIHISRMPSIDKRRPLAWSLGLVFLLLTGLSKAQTASFTISTTGGCSPLIVNFDGTSSSGTGSLNYNWDFGNGNSTSGTQFSTTSAIYTTAGTYTISLTVTDDVGTSTETTQSVTVFQNPTANFSFAGETTGCVTQTIAFTDASTPGDGTINAWTWDFGDGQGSSDQSPSHDYGTAGDFSVTLIARDDNGCQDDTTTSDLFSFTQPFTSDFDVAAPNNTTTTCESSLTVDFESLADTNAATGPFTYFWDFGDGNTSTSMNPTHEYTTYGVFTVVFSVTDASSGCAVTTTKTAYIKLEDYGAAFTATPTSGCNPLTVAFTNTSDSLAANQTVTWDLGDGTQIVGTGVSSSVLSFSHTYTTAGSYSPTLTIDDGTCSSEFTTSTAIQLTDTLSGTITVDNPLSCVLPHEAQFSVSISDAQSYIWDFGDGNSSTEQSPTHTYADYGEYTVSVITSDTANCSSVTTSTNIVSVKIPTASFSDDLVDQVVQPLYWSYSDENIEGGCIPITVNFTDSSSSENTITNWNWDFGDGATSTDMNPSHTYTTTGSFDVTLIITDDAGCMDTSVCTGCIEAGDQPDAIIDDGGYPKHLCCNVEEEFVNQTDEDEADFFYFYNNLGDNYAAASGGAINWEYMSDLAGEEDSTVLLTTTLIAYDRGCADTFNLVNWGELHTPYVKPIVLDDPCEFSATFTVDSLIYRGPVDHYEWSFEYQSQTSNDSLPTFNAPTDAGILELKIISYDSTNSWDLPGFAEYCTCEISSYLFFPGNATNRDFGASDSIDCTPFTVDFSAPNEDILTSWEWDFGDGNMGSGENVTHTYTVPGTYDVTLIVTDVGGCTDTIIKTSYIVAEGPQAIISATDSIGCVPLTLSFSDISILDVPLVSRAWSYGDGSISDTTSSVSHTWSAIPTSPTLQSEGYDLILALEDQKGCTDSDTIQIIAAEPVPAFEGTPTDRCNGDYYVFIPDVTDTTGIGPFGYSWSFPTGSPVSSLDSLASSELPDGGPHSVTLTMTDIYGCTGSTTEQYTVEATQPVASFQASPTEGTCPPVVVSFEDTSAIGRSTIVEWLWDFGNGSSSSLQNPTNIYTTQESFSIQLSVTDSLGCTGVTEVVDYINITGVTGNILASQDSACQDSTITLIAESPNAASYSWDMGDGTVLVGDTVQHAYASSGTRLPLLVMQDSTGLCSSQFTDTIVVLAPPDFDLGDDLLLCTGDSVTITTGLSGQTYLWSNGGTGESIIVSDSGDYNVTVTSPEGCPNLDSISVSEVPLPTISLESPTYVCTGIATDVTVTSDDSIVTYTWVRIDSTVGSTATISVTETESTTYYITVVDTNNCSLTDSTTMEPVERPTLTFDNPGGCIGGSYILNVSADTSATDELYIWSKDGAVLDTSTTITVDQEGTYSMQYLLGSCPSDSSVEALFFDLPDISATQVEFCNETEGSTTLDAGEGYISYAWLHSGEISQTVVVSDYDTYTYAVVDTNNCTDTTTVEVVEGCDLRFYYANAFTPNGDGQNDVFIAKGAYLTQYSMSVFNRWGEVIFFSDDINVGWDGTYRGKDMPGGVYTVVFTWAADGQDDPAVANHKVTLIR